jgi:hypothetical protein
MIDNNTDTIDIANMLIDYLNEKGYIGLGGIGSGSISFYKNNIFICLDLISISNNILKFIIFVKDHNTWSENVFSKISESELKKIIENFRL